MQPPRHSGARSPDPLRPRFETLARLMDEAKPDVLAFMTFPRHHGLTCPGLDYRGLRSGSDDVEGRATSRRAGHG